MWAWQALDKVTRAWYQQCADGEFLCCFVGLEYQWQGSKYVGAKTEERAQKIIASWYSQFLKIKEQNDKRRNNP